MRITHGHLSPGLARLLLEMEERRQAAAALGSFCGTAPLAEVLEVMRRARELQDVRLAGAASAVVPLVEGCQ